MDLQQLKQRLITDPYDLKNYDILISNLRLNKAENPQELFDVRLSKHSRFMLLQDEINETLEDLLSINEEQKRTELLTLFYDILVRDFATVYYWQQYLNFSRQIKDSDDLFDIFITALNDTAYDFDGSDKIWDAVLGFFSEIYENSRDEEDLDRLWKLYLKRISFPHKSLSDSYNQTSKFVSSYFPDNQYPSLMSAAEKIYSSTQKQQIYYEKHESNLNESFNDPQFWCDYLLQIGKYATNIKQVSCVFYRSLLVSDENWMSVWFTYIYFLYARDDSDRYLKQVLPQFVRAYPTSPLSYAELTRNLSIIEESSLEIVIEAVDLLDLMKNSGYDDWKVLAMAILTYEDQVEHPLLNSHMKLFYDHALDNDDSYHSVEKLCIAIEEKRSSPQLSKICSQLVGKFPHHSDVWLYVAQVYQRSGYSYSDVSRLYNEAVGHAIDMDWPESIIQEQLRYEQINGSVATYRSSLANVDTIIKKVMQKRLVKEEETDTQKRRYSETIEPTKRPKLEPKLVRNREELTVKVTGLTKSLPESEVRAFFEDCGTIKGITIYLVDNQYEAVIDFEEKQSVFAALTKSHKQIGSDTIMVKRLVNSIVWVTNFPPSFDEERIRDLFQQTGNVISVRLPTQTSTKARRFCYVEYSESEQAQSAVTNLNGKPLVDQLDNKLYKLIVKLSDNQAQKKAPVFKREVYISNIDFKVPESKIRDYFSGFGTIESVVLPVNAQMKNKGYTNGGFGFVVFQSETSVAEALRHSGDKLEGRPLNIHPSKKANSQKSISDELRNIDKEKSLAVKGFPNTASKSQIELFIKDTIGIKASRIIMAVEHQGVVIQFESVSDSGNASLKLETTKYHDQDLQPMPISQFMAEFHRGKSQTNPNNHKNPTLFVPASVQRR